MHELGIMQSTVDLAIETAQREHAEHVHAITMRVGEMSGVVREALEFAFDITTEGTIAEGAELIIESVPVVCICLQCEQDFIPVGYFYECPTCGQPTAKLRSGRELEIVSVEVS